MSLALRDRVCVVTGSAKSIGLGIAETYCREGAAVGLIDINPQVMEQSDRLSAAGYNTKAFVIDITDQRAVFECFQEIEKTLGPVFALANVAGFVDQQKIEDVTPERVDKVMQIKVNCLCPGITGDTGVWDSVSKGYTKELAMPMEAVVEKFTDKIPLQRLANIDDIVAYTRFLTVDGDYCMGQALNIKGGREVH